MTISILLLIIGLIALIKGADWLVDGASSLAARLGITPIVVGLTIVAFGTSAPELIVNLIASTSGDTDIAIGNILGSNIANILLILGIAGIIYPLTAKKNTVWKEIPFALLAVLVVGVMASDQLITGRTANSLDRIDGIVLIAFFDIFLYYTYGISKNNDTKEDEIEKLPLSKSLLLVFGGLAFLFFGGKFTVDSAVQIATALGVSERIIGLTIVAIGTSLPELLTSAVAAYRKKVDIAVGNIIGSNIFNIFWILGLSATIRPLPFSTANTFDIVVTIAVSLLLFLLMFIGKKHAIARWESIFFLLCYAGYVSVTVFQVL